MKHIRLYLFVLFTACSMFMVCPFAHAESMPSNIIDYLHSDMDTNFTNWRSSESYINQATSVCPYFVRYFVTINGANYTMYDFFCSEYLGINSVYLNNYYYSAGVGDASGRVVMTKSNSNILPSTGVCGYRFIIYNKSTLYCIMRYENTGTIPSSSSWFSTAYFYPSAYYIHYRPQTDPASSSFYVNVSNTISYGNLYINNGNNSFVLAENTAPVYADDDRLKFAIVDNIYGGKNLMTDIRQFINDFPIQDTSHSSVLLYPESITLSYSVDNVEKTLTLSSSNSSIKSKYIFETDLSNFDFDESAQNVIITKCDFTISGNTQGGQTETENYYISCDYYIKRYVQPIEQGSNSYESNLNGDQTSQETKASLQYLVTFREGYGLDFDEFSDLSFPDYYTYADVYLYNNTAAYNYLMDNILSVNAVAYIIQNIANTEDDVITQIGLFLDDSNYGEYYDVIVFDWIQETSSTYTHTYFYFETVSGRVKATTQFLQVMQDDLNKVKINTAAAFTAIDNFESESIQFFNAKLGLDADLLGWVKTIDNSINNLDFPIYDDSNIVSLLGQIKDLLSSPANEIDTPQECIQLYEAHPNYFDELWGTPTPSLRSASVTPSSNNPYISSDFVRADLVPAWWEGKTLTMIYILKNDGETSRFYNDILNGLFDSYENLIESDNSFNTFIDSLFKTGYDYTDSFYGHMFDLDYNPEAWDGGFAENE